MPLPRRPERINALLQERISQYLLTEVELPVGVLVTIIRVSVTPDLHAAKVYVSVIPEGQRGSVLKTLRQISGTMTRSLYRALSLHTVPILEFAIDDTEDRAAEVEHLIDTVNETPSL